MSTSKPDKKFIPLIALGAIVVAAAAFAITSSGGSGPAGNPKTTVAPSATTDAESTLVDIELMALVDKAVEDCKTFKISCLNTAAIDVYKEQGLPSMIAFTEIVTAQAPKSFKCLEWGKQLGADMHKKYGEKAVDMKCPDQGGPWWWPVGCGR